MIKIGAERNGLLWALLMVFFFLSGSPVTEAKEYGDIYMDSTKDSMAKADVGAVIFPHWFHRIRYKCKVCHEDIFVMRKGANNISMGDIMDGKSCGTCHNGMIAWEALECKKCHSGELTPAVKNSADANKQ